MIPAPDWAPVPFVAGGISAIFFGVLNRKRDNEKDPAAKGVSCLLLGCSGLALFLTVPIVMNFGPDWLLAICLFASSFLWLSAGRFLRGNFSHLLRKGLDNK